MEQFEFACIGASMTEDERVISHSLHHFATLIRTIEDERDRMLGRAHEQIIQPLERFRKEHIGAVKVSPEALSEGRPSHRATAALTPCYTYRRARRSLTRRLPSSARARSALSRCPPRNRRPCSKRYLKHQFLVESAFDENSSIVTEI
ncbi:hypothetical protein HF086_000273 [Spodoptera exigua]|uniref:BAR domain-containing protein n=1 Tax=Spodoptera exigua TaxID=7107 RepID=A0A922SBF6_SPOEX|nr:hypothetical protein HF086_000273 [Spodoptera exigua]